MSNFKVLRGRLYALKDASVFDARVIAESILEGIIKHMEEQEERLENIEIFAELNIETISERLENTESYIRKKIVNECIDEAERAQNAD